MAASPISLKTLAEGICNRVADAETCQISSWRKRLGSYSWRGSSAEETLDLLRRIESPMKPIFRSIYDQKALVKKDYTALSAFAGSVFSWGGVTNVNAKRAENGSLVESVIQAALFWDVSDLSAPMNSGWTKVGAIATEFREQHGGIPQIIFDSRVSASLLSRVEQVLVDTGVKSGESPYEHLPTELRALGYVPGRGGSRRQKNGTREFQLKWMNRYRRWDAQFSASRLVDSIKNHLNSNPGSHDRMPFSNFDDRRWSARGVEMVLFMDGY